jgi:type VI secretion system protein ImpA
MLTNTKLLQPISEAQPCGEDISFSVELDAIMQARRFDDPLLDQGEWVTELKEADWGFVVDHCAALLAGRSKDLRLAVWLAEASAKVHHFRGLGDAYLLLAGLCNQFWDGLYPLSDDDEYEQRIGNLSWLLARSVQLVREMPVTEGRDSAYSMLDIETARLLEANPGKQAAANRRHGDNVSFAEMELARRKSSPGFYATLLADADHCMDALLLLEKAVDARLGVNGPAFSAAREALASVIHTIRPLAQEAGAAGAGITLRPPELQESSNVLPLPLSLSLNQPVQNRDQALAQLRLIAEFFRRTEPHSPVAYLAEKAASWGELPLHDWLRSVVKDSSSLSHIEELLGL